MSKKSIVVATATESPISSENVSNETVVSNETIAADATAEGLEDADESEAVVSETAAKNYADRAWLEANTPEFAPEVTSKKFDKKREPKVQEGLTAIALLMGENINPLIVLLGKWWEVKPARAAIKKMIDAEAAEKGLADDFYLQVTLRENVDKLSTIQNAVDRLRYSITYFKPRAGLSGKEIFKILTIDGVAYNVSLTKLAEAKAKFGEENKEAIKAEMKAISAKIEEIL